MVLRISPSTNSKTTPVLTALSRLHLERCIQIPPSSQGGHDPIDLSWAEACDVVAVLIFHLLYERPHRISNASLDCLSVLEARQRKVSDMQSGGRVVATQISWTRAGEAIGRIAPRLVILSCTFV
jgi:hypothetical protein